MLQSIMTKMSACHENHRQLTHITLIILLGMIVYSGTLHSPFYFDDLSCITGNPLIRSFTALFDLENYRESGLPEDIRNNMVTRFVAYATFALNYRLHALSLPGYHLFNIAIHLLNAVLVYLLFRLTFSRSTTTPTNAHRGEWFALIVALIFVTHPVQTNAVTYIVQRFALLATCFYLVALLAYIQAATVTTRNRRRIFYTISFLATILAMYTKEISFTLPVMIALYDVAFLDGDRKRRLLRLTPILATMILIPLTVMTLSFYSANTDGNAANAIGLANLSGDAISRWDYFITQWRVIVTYLRLLLVPINLNFDYDYPVYTSLLQPPVFFSGLLLLALSSTGAWLLLRPQRNNSGDPVFRLVGFGLVWFFLTLVMESSIIRLDDIIYEYRLYLPAIGFIGAGVALGEWWVRRFVLRQEQMWRRTAVLLMITVLLGSLGVATILRNNVWRDDLRFWQDAVNKSPDKARPLSNLAGAYTRRERFEESIPLLERAKSLAPDIWIPYYQLGRIHLRRNNPAAAIAEFTQGIKVNRKKYELWRALGDACLQQESLQEAADAYQQVLDLKPGDPKALFELEGLQNRGIFPKQK